ncbi:MAG: ribosome biogenesis GTPase YlqF [Clostridia bacterium]|nr:ribosome biogenesis GTPase YlqF [Clostridia bacterium]
MSDNMSSINWFPGHMRKALNDIGENLKMVDIVYETCDARIPFSSRNPELNKIIGDKKRIVILNKADLADPDKTQRWIQYFKENGINAIALDSAKKKGLDTLNKLTLDVCSDILDKAKSKGRIGRPIRVMVVGVPNTGKSTLINGLCGKKVAVTGDKPGVTRAPKWLKTQGTLELMDMPGVLWPKIQSKRSQLCLTATGAIKNEVTDQVEVAYETIKLLNELYPDLMCDRFGITLPNSKDFEEDEYIEDDYDRFQFMARKRGCIMSGGRIDEERFAKQLLDDLRSSRIGRITFETADKPVK